MTGVCLRSERFGEDSTWRGAQSALQAVATPLGRVESKQAHLSSFAVGGLGDARDVEVPRSQPRAHLYGVPVGAYCKPFLRGEHTMQTTREQRAPAPNATPVAAGGRGDGHGDARSGAAAVEPVRVFDVSRRLSEGAMHRIGWVLLVLACQLHACSSDGDRADADSAAVGDAVQDAAAQVADSGGQVDASGSDAAPGAEAGPADARTVMADAAKVDAAVAPPDAVVVPVDAFVVPVDAVVVPVDAFVVPVDAAIDFGPVIDSAEAYLGGNLVAVRFRGHDRDHDIVRAVIDLADANGPLAAGYDGPFGPVTYDADGGFIWEYLPFVDRDRPTRATLQLEDAAGHLSASLSLDVLPPPVLARGQLCRRNTDLFGVCGPDDVCGPRIEGVGDSPICQEAFPPLLDEVTGFADRRRHRIGLRFRGRDGNNDVNSVFATLLSAAGEDLGVSFMQILSLVQPGDGTFDGVAVTGATSVDARFDEVATARANVGDPLGLDAFATIPLPDPPVLLPGEACDPGALVFGDCPGGTFCVSAAAGAPPTCEPVDAACPAEWVVGDLGAAGPPGGPWVVQGDPTTGADHGGGSCAGFGATEVWSFTAPQAGKYRIALSLDGNRYETFLFIREACAVPASELLCNNGTNPGNPGWITPTLAANEEIHVFVAGYGVALYTVTVTAVP
jgi:hypothetical protein